MHRYPDHSSRSDPRSPLPTTTTPRNRSPGRPRTRTTRTHQTRAVPPRNPLLEADHGDFYPISPVARTASPLATVTVKTACPRVARNPKHYGLQSQSHGSHRPKMSDGATAAHTPGPREISTSRRTSLTIAARSGYGAVRRRPSGQACAGTRSRPHLRRRCGLVG